jgi:DNA-binding XRE family transcriptional regulator
LKISIDEYNKWKYIGIRREIQCSLLPGGDNLSRQTPVQLKIRDCRKRAGMQQWKLAAEVGTTQSYISQLERNMINPSLDMLQKISDVLKVDVKELL